MQNFLLPAFLTVGAGVSVLIQQPKGMVVVLIARFVAVLRSVVGFIAGANRMPFANFMIANSAGAVAWALYYGLGAYYLGKGVK